MSYTTKHTLFYELAKLQFVADLNAGFKFRHRYNIFEMFPLQVTSIDNNLLFSHLHISLSFPPLLQRFQASLVDHMSVEVCTLLPKFQLTMVLIRPRQAAEPKGPAEEDGVQAADGAGGSVAAKRLREEGRGDLAYVLHTSGTTGRPKIVRVPHKCILPNIVHLRLVFIALEH